MMSTGTERHSALGRGLYSLGDLRAYLALSGSSADAARAPYWYERVLLPDEHHRKWRPDYSFRDLISLFVVRELKQHGVRTRDIRTAEDYLRQKWKTRRPFANGTIQTDGSGIFVDQDLIAGQLESADRRGQQAMLSPLRDRLTAVRYDEATGFAANWSPEPEVVIDPRIQFGSPVLSGSRIPTSAVADMASWATTKTIQNQLQISAARVEAALSFEQKLNALRN